MFNADKEKDFSTWFSEIISKAGLADLRYNVKGFVVFREWSVLAFNEMYALLERILQRKGHWPVLMPALIPEENLNKEAGHVKGFVPEVFWVTEHGAGEKFEQRMALRPTSETAFYHMYALWIRSYKDLPFKRYQRCQVWRHETNATRPFLRSREFYWIEAHCAFQNEQGAWSQVREDMETTKEFMHETLGVPFIFFQRPQWDRFAGAVETFAADTLTPDGRVLQQPSTHYLGENFSKPFNVQYVDASGAQQYAHLTCYGPAISRIFASVIAVHGDKKGLRFPFKVAPVQVVIVPFLNGVNDSKVLAYCEKLRVRLSLKFRVHTDASETRAGEKFYFWEMKGVPFRVEVGSRELKSKKAIVFRRDSETKKEVSLPGVERFIEKTALDYDATLRMTADKAFKNNTVNVSSWDELKAHARDGKFIRANFCSTAMNGVECAEKIEKELGLSVRGSIPFREEKTFGPCVACGKPSTKVVYVGKQY